MNTCYIMLIPGRSGMEVHVTFWNIWCCWGCERSFVDYLGLLFILMNFYMIITKFQVECHLMRYMQSDWLLRPLEYYLTALLCSFWPQFNSFLTKSQCIITKSHHNLIIQHKTTRHSVNKLVATSNSYEIAHEKGTEIAMA